MGDSQSLKAGGNLGPRDGILHQTVNRLSVANQVFLAWEIDGETVETVLDFIFGGAPKSLQMVTAAMKLKDAYSLEGKL